MSSAGRGSGRFGALAALVFLLLARPGAAAASDEQACAASFAGGDLGSELGLEPGAVQVVERDGPAWATAALAAALEREGFEVERVVGEVPEEARTAQRVMVGRLENGEEDAGSTRFAVLEIAGTGDEYTVECGERPARMQGVLGVLRTSDEESAAIFGVGGLAVGGLMGSALGAGAAIERKVEQYLDEMLWLTETHVATETNDVQRVYSFALGRDKRELNLEQLLEQAGEHALLEKVRTRQSQLLWLSNGPAFVGMAAMGLGLVALASALPMIALDVPDDVTIPVIYGSTVVMGGGLAVALAGVIAGAIIGPYEQDVPEHELRRVVREHNERLRAHLGIEASRDEIPSGLPE